MSNEWSELLDEFERLTLLSNKIPFAAEALSPAFQLRQYRRRNRELQAEVQALRAALLDAACIFTGKKTVYFWGQHSELLDRAAAAINVDQPDLQ